MLIRILFVYARENSGVQYIQGMNEILAPIVYVLHTNKMVPNFSARPRDPMAPFHVAMDAAYLEHDAYTIFHHLLVIVGRWFSLPNREPSSGPVSRADVSATSAITDQAANNQIVNQCRYIHFTLLEAVDPHLASYLKDLAIEPHLYMLRWLRILLAQVFPLPDLLLLWDGIFAWGKQAELLDWLCVSMLATIRHLLLGKDYSICMQTLFNYPPTSDPRILLTTAVHMLDKYNKIKTRDKTPKPTVAPLAPAPSTDSLNTKMIGSTKALLQPLTTSLTSTFKQMFVADDPELELARLRTTQLHMANRLDRIVYILQNTPSEESLKSAVEELCQIKQTLASGVYPESGPGRPADAKPGKLAPGGGYSSTAISPSVKRK
eukprot:TRINITY_DN5037_c0_g1_i6.p1 TRINITY_DN5037_c0_g1~~TRINITY_DN5037_c0_g1_i6.p1  ORF type:complete len:377 (+),score=89.12 TRINITY_DN5037_c0_g1_i6:538-1668(+)